jgi:hypothetical protein
MTNTHLRSRNISCVGHVDPGDYDDYVGPRLNPWVIARPAIQANLPQFRE